MNLHLTLVKPVLGVALCLCLLGAQKASAQCYNVAVAIASGVVNNKKPKTVKAAVGAVVYTLRSGVVSIQNGSTVAFAAAKGKVAQIQSSGAATGLTVNGDITAVPKDVIISGVIPYPTKDRGTVQALVTITSSGMKLKSVTRGRKVFKELTGKTGVQIVDVGSGAVLYKQRPLPFAKTRSFRYQWQAVSCFGAGTGGTKK